MNAIRDILDNLSSCTKKGGQNLINLAYIPSRNNILKMNLSLGEFTPYVRSVGLRLC